MRNFWFERVRGVQKRKDFRKLTRVFRNRVNFYSIVAEVFSQFSNKTVKIQDAIETFAPDE